VNWRSRRAMEQRFLSGVLLGEGAWNEERFMEYEPQGDYGRGQGRRNGGGQRPEVRTNDSVRRGPSGGVAAGNDRGSRGRRIMDEPRSEPRVNDLARRGPSGGVAVAAGNDWGPRGRRIMDEPPIPTPPNNDPVRREPRARSETAGFPPGKGRQSPDSKPFKESYPRVPDGRPCDLGAPPSPIGSHPPWHGPGGGARPPPSSRERPTAARTGEPSSASIHPLFRGLSPSELSIANRLVVQHEADEQSLIELLNAEARGSWKRLEEILAGRPR
jgi:hypothetical protein